MHQEFVISYKGSSNLYGTIGTKDLATVLLGVEELVDFIQSLLPKDPRNHISVRVKQLGEGSVEIVFAVVEDHPNLALSISLVVAVTVAALAYFISHRKKITKAMKNKIYITDIVGKEKLATILSKEGNADHFSVPEFIDRIDKRAERALTYILTEAKGRAKFLSYLAKIVKPVIAGEFYSVKIHQSEVICGKFTSADKKLFRSKVKR